MHKKEQSIYHYLQCEVPTTCLLQRWSAIHLRGIYSISLLAKSFLPKLKLSENEQGEHSGTIWPASLKTPTDRKIELDDSTLRKFFLDLVNRTLRKRIGGRRRGSLEPQISWSDKLDGLCTYRNATIAVPTYVYKIACDGQLHQQANPIKHSVEIAYETL